MNIQLDISNLTNEDRAAIDFTARRMRKHFIGDLDLAEHNVRQTALDMIATERDYEAAAMNADDDGEYVANLADWLPPARNEY